MADRDEDKAATQIDVNIPDKKGVVKRLGASTLKPSSQDHDDEARGINIDQIMLRQSGITQYGYNIREAGGTNDSQASLQYGNAGEVYSLENGNVDITHEVKILSDSNTKVIRLKGPQVYPLTAGESINTSLYQHDRDYSQDSGANAKPLLNFKNQKLDQQLGTIKSERATVTTQIVSNSQDMREAAQKRANLLSAIDRQRKTFPRKRYYNGIGKIMPTSIKQLDTVTQRAQMASLSSRQDPRGSKKAVQNTQMLAFNMHEPDPKVNANRHKSIETTQRRSAYIRPIADQQHQEFDNQTVQNQHTQPLIDKTLQDSIQVVDTNSGQQLIVPVHIYSSTNVNNEEYSLTLDKYKWAQKQGLPPTQFKQRTKSMGGNRVKQSRVGSSNNPTKADSNTHMKSDFMVSEAAISHMMHQAQADQYPKIKFVLADGTGQKAGEHDGPPRLEYDSGKINESNQNSQTQVQFRQSTTLNSFQGDSTHQDDLTVDAPSDSAHLLRFGQQPRRSSPKQFRNQQNIQHKFQQRQIQSQQMNRRNKNYTTSGTVPRLTSIVSNIPNLPSQSNIVSPYANTTTHYKQSSHAKLPLDAIHSKEASKETIKRNNLDESIQSEELNANAKEFDPPAGYESYPSKGQHLVKFQLPPSQLGTVYPSMHPKSVQSKKSKSVTYDLQLKENISNQRDGQAGEYTNKGGTQMMKLSSGNVYCEGLNPSVAKYVQKIQDSLQHSEQQLENMKGNKERVFKMMKRTKTEYMQTLEKGEDEGHCTGIKFRNDPTKKITAMIEVKKQQRLFEEKRLELQKVKKVKNESKEKATRERAKKRIQEIDEIKKYGGLKKYFQTRSGKKQVWKGIFAFADQAARVAHVPHGAQHQTGEVLQEMPEEEEEANHLELKINDKSEKKNVNFQLDESGEKGDEGEVIDPENSNMFSEDVNDDLNANGKGKEQQNKDLQVVQDNGSTAKGKGKPRQSCLSIPASALSSTKKPGLPFAMPAAESTKKKAHWSKMVQKLQDILCIKDIREDQIRSLESIFTDNKPAKGTLCKLLTYMQRDQFLQWRHIQSKGTSLTSLNPKQKVIFDDGAGLGGRGGGIGLISSKKFEDFFRSHCLESDRTVKNLQLNRQSFKEMLQDRYSNVVGDKILLFLETYFLTLYKQNINLYTKLITDILNRGPDLYKGILFACLSLSNTGRICEHDLYYLIEQFRQRNSFYFYKDLIKQKDVPRDFKEIVDDSDEIFFQAFNEDIKQICNAINLRKRVLGIVDADVSENVESDINLSNFNSEEEYEDTLANHIDYLIGIILTKGGPQYQNEVAEILMDNTSLPSLRKALIDFIVEQDKEHRFLKRRDRRKEINITNLQELKKEQDNSMQNVTFIKPPTKVIPCLGSGTNARTGNKISQCSYLCYEDFNKLVRFKKAQNSQFVEDLIDLITDGLVSVNTFEKYLGPVRDGHESYHKGSKMLDRITKDGHQNGFKGPDCLEYIAVRNKEEHGHVEGSLSKYYSARRKRLNHGKLFQIPHEITAPYTVQALDSLSEHASAGMLLINKHQLKKKSSRQIKKIDFEGTLSGTDTINDILSEEELEELSSQRQTAQYETSMVPINEEQTGKLATFKNYFGGPNFFKVFRAFYKLSNIPEDAQNNPFALYMDRNSIKRSFEEVFGVNNDELALRFGMLFVEPPGLPKLNKIDIIRFYEVVNSIRDTNSKSTEYLKLAFRFMDYDNDGLIGSVDILKLRASIEGPQTEKIAQTFHEMALKRQVARELQIQVTKSLRSKLGRGGLKPGGVPASPLGALQPKQAIVDDSASNSSSKSEESEEAQARKEREEIEKREEQNWEQQLQGDPWMKFIFEVHRLRDYYVDEALIKQSKGSTVQFMDYKTYELEFLALIEKKYQVESPTIIHFMKSKLFYSESELEKKQKVCKEKWYEGFRKAEVAEITPEIIEMEKVLDTLSTAKACATQEQPAQEQ